MTFTPAVENTISAANSTTSLLAPNATWTGAWENVTKYTTVAVAIKGSNVTDGTLYIESSQDGGVVVNSVPFTITDASFDLPHIWNVVESDIRVRYTNGTTAQTGHFQLQTKYSNGQQLGLLQSAGDTINATTSVQIVKSLNTSTDPNANYNNSVGSGVDDNNSSTLALGISGSFTGTWSNVSGYHGITVLVDGTSAGTADGTLLMQFSHDGVTINRSISVTVSDVTAAAPRTLGVVAKYFRVIYNNGTTATTTFDLQTMFHTSQVTLISRLNQPVDPSVDVTYVRSINTGEEPDGNFTNSKQDGDAFVTTATLNNGVQFDSAVLDARGYNQVQTSVNASHDGLLTFSFYSDAGGTNLVRSIGLPYVVANGYQLYSAPAFANFVKYSFLNDSGVNQTSFYYSTKLLTKALSGQVLSIAAPLNKAMVANLGRNVIVGQDDAGNFRNVKTDTENHLEVNIADPKTAFGDLRTAQLSPVVQLTFAYNINGEMVTTTENNGGTVTQSDSMAVLSTSTNVAGEAIMRSRGVITYRAGLGILSRFTGMFTNGGAANSTQMIGVGTNEDGLFFGYDGATFGILKRRATIDTWYPQTTWNVDVMDGSGSASTNPSNMLLDHTKINVFEIQFQWLGAGKLSFFIENDNTGAFAKVHEIAYANANTIPSILNPTLALCSMVQNSGNTSDLVLKTASMSGFIEGRNIRTGPVNSHNNTNTHSTETALFTLQNKTTFFSKTNRVRVYLEQLAVANDVNQLATFRIYRNATLTDFEIRCFVPGE